MERHNTRSWNPEIQARHQFNRLYSRSAECTLERHGAQNTHHLRETTLSYPFRPAPSSAPPRFSPPKTARLTERCACAGTLAAAEHSGKCSLCAVACGPRVLLPGGTWRSQNTLATGVLIPIFTPVGSPRTHAPSPRAGLRSGRIPRENAISPLPFSGLC